MILLQENKLESCVAHQKAVTLGQNGLLLI